MESEFRPNMRTVTYITPPQVGSEIEVQPGEFNADNSLTPTGEPYVATVTGVGDTYASVCPSRNRENCPKCPFPPRFCEAPIR